MNKKFLSAVLFGALMVGSSVTFTGCIDNDEPAGITDLRGAKAELLRAKVAVETAKAARENAEAALTLAKAETEKANAELVKANVQLQKLMAEAQAAQNEAEKARLEAEIAQYKQQMEEDVLTHQKTMLALQEELALAKRQYEIALKQIEIAQAVMSDEDKVTLGSLELAVTEAQGKVDDKAEAVKEKEEAYYNAVLESRVDTVNFKRLELAVTRAKANQVVAEETLEKWSDFLKADTETADWRKEITTLEDSIKGLEKKQSELKVELAKLQNSEDYKKLIDAKNQTAKAYAELKTSAELKYKDMMSVERKVAKGTPINDAMKAIGGEKKDGKGGFIAELNGKIADYTSEKKALLDEIAAQTEGEVKELKEASDEAIKAWKEATAAYATAKAYSTEEADKEAVEKALETYTEAMDAAGEDAKKQLKAQQAFADAIVKYYKAAAPVQLTTNKVSIELTVGTGDKAKTTWVSKTVQEWLSDSDNKDVYLMELISYFGGDAKKLWAKGDAEKFNSDTENIETKATGALKTIKSVNDILTELQDASNAAFGEVSLYGKNLAGTENGYMRVEPTEAEIKAIANYGEDCGALGRYYASTDATYAFEAKNYKEIIASYEKGVEYWTAQLATLKKTEADAKAAKKAAQDALDKYEEDNFEALETEIYGEIGGRIRALNAIKAALIDAVNVWLPENGNYQDTEKFETWLKGRVEAAEDAVIDAEEAVVRAENNLIEAKDGKYDALTDAKEALDKAMAELEKAQAELATATADLQKGVDIMSKTTSAE